MKNIGLLTLLASHLSLGAVDAQNDQAAALDTWLEKHLPILRQRATELFTGPIDLGEFDRLLQAVDAAADELRDLFKGTERAKIAMVVARWLAHEYAPPAWQVVLDPLLSLDVLPALIEAAWRQLFPDKAAEKAGLPPVVDASDVEAGGVQ